MTLDITEYHYNNVILIILDLLGNERQSVKRNG